MKRRNIVILVVAAVVVVAAVALAATFASSPYSGYSKAFDRTTKPGSMAFSTRVNISVDGALESATGEMKIKGLPNAVQFINTMSIGASTITQFTDGTYIYMDDGTAKTRFKIGETPAMAERGEYRAEDFAQEFAGLLDASKLKDLKIVDKLGQNLIQSIKRTRQGEETRYEITLATQLVDELFAQVMNEQVRQDIKPVCTLRAFTYAARENANGCIDSISYSLDMDATLPPALTGEAADVTRSVRVDLELTLTDPGTAVDFTLPDTDGYQQMS